MWLFFKYLQKKCILVSVSIEKQWLILGLGDFFLNIKHAFQL